MILRRLKKFQLLASRRLAIFVMISMAALLGLAAVVPEAELSDPKRVAELAAERPVILWIAENLRPQELVKSSLFLVLTAYLFIAIAVSTVLRVLTFARAKRLGHQRESERFRVERAFRVEDPPEEATRRIRGELARARYAIDDAGPAGVRGRKGNIGFVGSIGFHVGMLLVLAGVAASGQTRLNGQVLLAEGIEVPFEAGSFVTLAGEEHLTEVAGITLAIREFTAEYTTRGSPLDFATLLAVRRDGELLREAVTRVNAAFGWQGYHFTLHRYGFAPELVMSDANGAILVDAVTLLRILPPGQEDAVPLPGGGELRVSLYPDFVMQNGAPKTRTFGPRNPMLFFSWHDGPGREVGRGRLSLGQEVEVDGGAIRFESLRYWAGFMVARDGGLWFLILGSLIGTLGLALRLAFPDQTFEATIVPGETGSEIEIIASTRFFPALHEEQVDALITKLGGSEAES